MFITFQTEVTTEMAQMLKNNIFFLLTAMFTDRLNIFSGCTIYYIRTLRLKISSSNRLGKVLVTNTDNTTENYKETEKEPKRKPG